MIYVAGRYKVILAYERRMFPKLNPPLFTGARLCTLSSFPSQPSTSQYGEDGTIAANGDSGSGEILVAGGEYNGHGSLEIYPASTLNYPCQRPVPDSNGFLPSMTGAHPHLKRYNHGVVNPNIHHLQHDLQQNIVASSLTTVPAASRGSPEIVRNRQSASRSKILSVDATQGTRLITGDADGIVRWVERDGREEIRRYDIFAEKNGYTPNSSFYLFFNRQIPNRVAGGARWGDGNAGYASANGTMRSEVVRKLISFGNSTGSGSSTSGTAQAGVVVWTGERLGVLSVGHQRLRKHPRDLGKVGVGGAGAVGGEEESSVEEDAERYEMEMRRALERQGDEMSMMRGFGLLG